MLDSGHNCLLGKIDLMPLLCIIEYVMEKVARAISKVKAMVAASKHLSYLDLLLQKLLFPSLVG